VYRWSCGKSAAPIISANITSRILTPSAVAPHMGVKGQ
jgi:hypothetical protein